MIEKIIIGFIIFLIFFPFRSHFLRHWRVTFPALIGAIFGFVFSTFLIRESSTYLPLWYRDATAVVGAIIFALQGKILLDRLFPPSR